MVDFAHRKLGIVESVERNVQIAAILLYGEVRYDLRRDCLVAACECIARLGVEMQYLVDCFTKIFVVDAQMAADEAIFFSSKAIEIFIYDNHCIVDCGRRMQSAKLEQQTFTKVAGSDSGRLELLHKAECRLELRQADLDRHRERKVVGNIGEATRQITVIVEASDEIFGEVERLFVGIELVELRCEAIFERLFGGKSLLWLRGSIGREIVFYGVL